MHTIDPRAKLAPVIGRLIDAEMRRLTLTDWQVSSRTGILQQSVRLHRSGTSEPRLAMLLAYERAFERPAGWFAQRVLAELGGPTPAEPPAG